MRLLLLALSLLSGCAHMLVPAGACPFPGRGYSSAPEPAVESTECRMACLQALGHVGACTDVGPQL
jgi:hypothetical protein